MGTRRGAYRVLVGKPEKRILLERPGRGGIVLKWNFEKWNVGGVWGGGHRLD
jgi:hypothetical protein